MVVSNRAHTAEALPGWRLTWLLSSVPPAALDFYQRRGFLLGDSTRASALPRPGPYVPQCDAWGGWEPVQCHAGTGERGWAPWGGGVCVCGVVTPPFLIESKGLCAGISELDSRPLLGSWWQIP